MKWIQWLYPGMKLKRWLLLFALGVILTSLGLAVVFNYQFISQVETQIFLTVYRLTGTHMPGSAPLAGLLVFFAGVAAMVLATKQMILSITSVLLPEGVGSIVQKIYDKRKRDKGPSVVVLGGGTGLSVLLRGLKKYTSNLTAIVTVADDGGSSGRLRQELGMIPPGDLRNCLVALAETEPLMEKLFQHRFGGGGMLAGHSFGNLFIAAMNEVLGDVELAIKESSKVLAVCGQVLPATTQPVRLVATMTDGSLVDGESRIPLSGKNIQHIAIEPADVKPVASALEAIAEADACVLGPGSLYTSVLPNLLVKEIADGLRHSPAVKIYICNVMTQPGETDRYTASRHIKAIIDHLGPGVIDYAIINVQTVAPHLKEAYAREGAIPVEADVQNVKALGVQPVMANIISETSLVRHNSVQLSRIIMDMVEKIRYKNPVPFLDYYLYNLPVSPENDSQAQ